MTIHAFTFERHMILREEHKRARLESSNLYSWGDVDDDAQFVCKMKNKNKNIFNSKLGLMRSSYNNYPPPAAQSIQPEGM